MGLHIVVAVCLILLAPFAAAPAAAQTYEVTGVAADDVLNVRDGPNHTARKLTEYPPDADSIRVLRRRGGWAEVRRAATGPADGWVNAIYLRRSGARKEVPQTSRTPASRPPDSRTPGKRAAANLAAPFRCFGAEPFWGLDVLSRTEARFTEPERPEGVPFAVTDIAPRDGGLIFRLTDGRGLGIVQREVCRDGIGEKPHDFMVRLTLPQGRTLSGCCRPLAGVDVDQ
jgi:uncharacterized membrane protein